MRTVAIIQARMGSTRLPGKVLADIQSKPMLYHIVSRARSATLLDEVGVATSDHVEDAAIARFCDAERIPCFRGNQDDVLDRYHSAAASFGAEVVVRLTGDCPLLDPQVIDRVVRVFLEGDYDYVSNTLEPSFPDGLDTEVVSRAALDRVWREAELKSEREHVMPFLWKNPAIFRLKNVKAEVSHADLRWTVDEPQDLRFVRVVYARLYRENAPLFTMGDVLDLLAREPGLGELNAGIGRNEGYEKSLSADSKLVMTNETRRGRE
jgi:spore coat polysaccharide biosynthesis protein SpsF (cytidylyltransferase family)